MKQFINGKTLCRGFFNECAKPILERFHPTLKYTAGLLGYGSDVIGYDDEVSTDHMWGPRFYLFLEDKDIGKRDELLECFSENLPLEYKGYSCSFSPPDPDDAGVRVSQKAEGNRVSPLIFIHTIDEYLNDYIGTTRLETITVAEWLTIPEHRLLALRCGELYEDMLALQERLNYIHYYPNNVKNYLIMSQWEIVSQEQAFVKRTAARGDEIGSRIICSRIVERLMRLCFLYCNEYAPYSKWFGTAFNRLSIDEKIKETFLAAISAVDIKQREELIARAQQLVGELHNSLDITPTVENTIQSYFNRDIQVIYSDRFANAMSALLKGTELEGVPSIGTLTQVGNLVSFSDNPIYRDRIMKLYKGENL